VRIPAIAARRCAAPVDLTEPTGGLFFDVFGEAVSSRAAAEGITTTGIGVGGCNRSLASLRISIDDWHAANRLVAIIHEEAARWDAGGSIAVLVTGTATARNFRSCGRATALFDSLTRSRSLA
jgi:hypothetical protein